MVAINFLITQPITLPYLANEVPFRENENYIMAVMQKRGPAATRSMSSGLHSLRLAKLKIWLLCFEKEEQKTKNKDQLSTAYLTDSNLTGFFLSEISRYYSSPLAPIPNIKNSFGNWALYSHHHAHHRLKANSIACSRLGLGLGCPNSNIIKGGAGFVCAGAAQASGK